MMFKCGTGPELICLSVSFSNSMETEWTPLLLQSIYHEQVSTTSNLIMYLCTILQFFFVFPIWYSSLNFPNNSFIEYRLFFFCLLAFNPSNTLIWVAKFSPRPLCSENDTEQPLNWRLDVYYSSGITSRSNSSSRNSSCNSSSNSIVVVCCVVDTLIFFVVVFS